MTYQHIGNVGKGHSVYTMTALSVTKLDRTKEGLTEVVARARANDRDDLIVAAGQDVYLVSTERLHQTGADVLKVGRSIDLKGGAKGEIVAFDSDGTERLARLAASDAPLPRPTTSPPPAAQAAPAAVAPAGTQSPRRFESIAAYKAWVAGSEVAGLPRARQAAAAAQSRVDQARQALDACRHQHDHAGLSQALLAAEKALLQATYPQRDGGQASKLQAQAMGLMAEAHRVEEKLQLSLYKAYPGNKVGDTGLRTAIAVVEVASGNYGMSAAYHMVSLAAKTSSSNGWAESAIKQRGQIADLGARAQQLFKEAGALSGTPGNAAAIASARRTRDEARAAFDASLAAQAPLHGTLDAASRDLAVAGQKLERLEGLKREMADYDAHFSASTRVGLTVSNWGWKKELDALWGGL